MQSRVESNPTNPGSREGASPWDHGGRHAAAAAAGGRGIDLCRRRPRPRQPRRALPILVPEVRSREEAADERHRPRPSTVSPASLAAAAAGFAEAAARGSSVGDESKSFAEAALAFAEAARAFAEANEEEEEPRDPRFAEDLKGRASALAVAADLLLQERGMSVSTTTTGLALMALNLCRDSQALLPAFALLPASSAEEGVPGRETELQSLLRRAGQFSTDSSGTTMEKSAKDFYEAAEAFASGYRTYEKVADIPLSQAARNLSMIASMAPPKEKELVLIARKLESDASVLVLDDDNSILVQRNVLKLKRHTCMQWLLACISGPSLPLHRHDVKRQEKLAEKRQVIFVIVLSTSIALLTTMIAGSVLPDEHTPWVGGVSASIWVLVNAGFVMNLYGKTSFELRAAQHLSRLGMLGLAILVCIYMYM